MKLYSSSQSVFLDIGIQLYLIFPGSVFLTLFKLFSYLTIRFITENSSVGLHSNQKYLFVYPFSFKIRLPLIFNHFFQLQLFVDDMLFDRNVVIFWAVKQGMSCFTIVALKHFKLVDVIFTLILDLAVKLIVGSTLLESGYELFKT